MIWHSVCQPIDKDMKNYFLIQPSNDEKHFVIRSSILNIFHGDLNPS